MLKKAVSTLAFLLAFAVMFVLVKELKSYWFASESMQTASETVAATADKEIRAAQEQAISNKSTTDILIEKGQKDAENTLNRSGDDKKKLTSASNFFFGAYLMNTRSRPEYCKSLGVSIAKFVDDYQKVHKDLFASAERIQIEDFRQHGYKYDFDDLYKLVLPTLQKYLVQDMKDTSTELKISEHDLCQSFQEHADVWVDQLDYRRRAPEVARLLLQH